MAGSKTENMLKVVFELDPGDWHGFAAEALWGERVSDGLPPRVVLMNIPSHVTGVSFLDTVRVELETLPDGNQFRFAGVTARGGHSTYMILAPLESAQFPAYWSRLQALGCRYESGACDTSYGRQMLYAVDVPPEADIDAVVAVLENGDRDGVWIFQTGNVEHTRRRVSENVKFEP